MCSTYLVAMYSLFPLKHSGYRKVLKTAIAFKKTNSGGIKLINYQKFIFIHMFLRPAAVSWNFILEKLPVEILDMDNMHFKLCTSELYF